MNSTQITGGVFCSLLTVAFITLKLIGAIHWSWVWVLAPLWLPAALAVLVMAGLAFFAFAGVCWISYAMSYKAGGR